MLEGDIVIAPRGVKFYNEETRYAIVFAVAPAKDPNRQITFKGVLDHPTDGASYHVKGYMEFDFSRQSHYFKIRHSEPKEHKTSEGWAEYLMREGPNVGDHRAKELVTLFGDQVIHVLANDPDKALSIQGLSADRLKELSEWAQEEILLADTKKMLYALGITPGLVRRLVMKYGRSTTKVVKTDPFLTMEVDGIGFATASKIGEAVGCTADNPRRIKCGIIHTMKEHAENGHTCIVWDRLVEKAQKLLGVAREKIILSVKELIAESLLCTQRSDPRPFAKNHELFPSSSPSA